ncbi:hypothetical protein ACS0TY_035943 [Phlomoides rotata]
MELVRQRAQRLTLCSFWHPDGHGRGCDNVSDHICIGLTWMHGGVMLMAEGLLGKSNGRSCTINFSKVFSGFENDGSGLRIMIHNPNKQYLKQGSQSQEGNPIWGEQQVKDECCRSLKNLENQGCECEGIQQAAMKAQQHMGQGQQSEQVYQRAQQLPQTCNLKTQQCRFKVIFL